MDKLVKPAIILTALLAALSIGVKVFFHNAIQHSEPEHVEQKMEATELNFHDFKTNNPISFKRILLNQNGAEAALLKLCAEHPLNSQGKGISINCSQKKLHDESQKVYEIPDLKPKDFKFYVDYAMFTNANATFSLYKDTIASIHVDVTDGLDESIMSTKEKYNIHTVVKVFDRIYGVNHPYNHIMLPWTTFEDEQGNSLIFNVYILPDKYKDTVMNIEIHTPALHHAAQAEAEARSLYLDKVAKEVSHKL